MAITTEVTFHGVDHSDVAEAEIRRRADHMERYFDHIVFCKVTVEKPNNRRAHGDHFDIHIRIGVPGPDIIISNEAKPGHNHEDPYIIIRDAFDAAERKLKKHADKIRKERTRQARIVTKTDIPD